MKRRTDTKRLAVIAGTVLLAFLLCPMTAGAKVFTYDKGPSFTIEHPDVWTDDPENPWGAMYRVKAAAGVPVLDVQVFDIPKGESLETIGKYWKKNVIDKDQKVDTVIVQDKMITLPDGTKANETIYEWNYKGVVDLRTINLSTFENGKWVYATINQTQDSDPLTAVLHTLKFKK